jgi:hypothetical protein
VLLVCVDDGIEILGVAVRTRVVNITTDREQPLGVFRFSAARIAASPVLIISCARCIQSSPFLARGTSIRRFPASATVTAALRTTVHSSSVFGRISRAPSFVSIDFTASQMASAFGSTTACMSSFVSTTGLNGGGTGPPHPANNESAPASASVAGSFRMNGNPNIAGEASRASP